MGETKNALTVLLVISALTSICHATLSIEIILAPKPGPVGGAMYPPGYTSWDVMATTTDMDLVTVEIYVEAHTPTTGDFYQNPNDAPAGPPSSSDISSDPLVEFDTYVTMPVDFVILGAATALVPGQRPLTFHDQLLDIAWGASMGYHSGAGTFHVARITVKDGIRGTWQFRAVVSGGNFHIESGYTELGSSFFTPGPILFGDVNTDELVNSLDLNIIIANWGLSGATPSQGDLNGNGVVDGPDYTEVLSYWSPAPEPPGERTPEPATLGLLLVGGLVLLRRRRTSV